jgi:hypothetical protein
MDFLDPKKHRAHMIKLMIGYVLIAVMVLLATVTLIYYAYGFGVNRNGELVQKGLVFVSSEPSGAQVRLNSKYLDNTNTKLTIDVGDYRLNLHRDGYHDWNRHIEVRGSSVSHYVYPFLVPATLNPTVVKSYDTVPILSTLSPDRRWLVTLQDAATGVFEMADLRKDQDTVGQTTTFTLPAELMSPSSGAPPTWELVEWSNNNRHMLFKRTYQTKAGPKFEYILVDRQRPEGSHNLTRNLSLAPTKLTLLDKQPDAYYLYDAATKELSTATLGEPTPVKQLSHVLDYKTHGRRLVLCTWFFN